MKPDGSAAKRTATYADIEALPDHVVGELIAGELIVSPRPAPRHAHSASTLGMKLGPPYHFGDGGPGGWWILDEPELHLGGDVVVPDLAGWRRERLPALPDTAWFAITPDWVCEVISPSTARIDRAAKLPLYARERVGHVWLLDPDARTLEVFRLQQETYLVVAICSGAETVRAEPFDTIDPDLAALWSESHPSPPP